MVRHCSGLIFLCFALCFLRLALLALLARVLVVVLSLHHHLLVPSPFAPLRSAPWLQTKLIWTRNNMIEHKSSRIPFLLVHPPSLGNRIPPFYAIPPPPPQTPVGPVNQMSRSSGLWTLTKASAVRSKANLAHRCKMTKRRMNGEEIRKKNLKRKHRGCKKLRNRL